jgi:membrane fusion protein (multidrug efflux system)
MISNMVKGTAIVALGVSLISACGQAGGAEPPAGEDQRVRTMNVEVVEVRPRQFTEFVRVVGTVEAEQDVTVSAEEGGVVQAVLARKGERVRAGAPLLKIDDDVLRAQLEQAVSQAELAEETWTRQKRLWEDDHVGTEIAYLQAKYNAQTARAQARVLDQRVARTTVRAPIAGILDDRLVEVGSMVAAGTPVARILDVDTVKLVGGVPERFAADIERGAEVNVAVQALGGRVYAGAIDFVGSAVAGDNRTFQIEVDVPNPGMGIKPGMVADIRISSRTLDSALVVPRNAVLRRETGYVVYVAEPNGTDGHRAVARAVVPGATREDQMVIEEGLDPGDLVVVVGQQSIAHGDNLRLTNLEPSAVEGGRVPDTTPDDHGEPGNGEEGEG